MTESHYFYRPFIPLPCDALFPVLLPVVTGGPLPSDHEFELHEVRFHWGKENQRGSEHTVNFKAFPMEVESSHKQGCRAETKDTVHMFTLTFTGWDVTLCFMFSDKTSGAVYVRFTV